MAVVSTDPAYRALASRAARRLGTSSPSIVAAILAQWQCELGNDPYPPRRNNPGNVAAGWTRSLGIPFTVETPNPQPSNPIVTFSSPLVGADAYADGLRKFSRYRGAMAAVARGDGYTFLREVTSAGYGTGFSCSASVYSRLGGAVPPGGTLSSAADAPKGTATPAAAPGACDLDHSFLDNRVVTQADVDRIVSTLRSQGCFDYLGANPLGPSGAEGTVRAIYSTAIGRVWDKPLQLEIQAKLAAAASSAGDPLGMLGGVLAGLPDALGTVARSTFLFVALVGLAIVGLYLVARG